MKIIHANETLPTHPPVIVIVGNPGVWKTTVAYSADDPLLLDFDRGAVRAFFRKDTVVPESWADVVNVSDDAAIENYKTIVVDTVGRALDMLSVKLIADNPKNSRGAGELSLQGYGALKSAFNQWINRLRASGKTIVLVAHAREDTRGDDAVIRPDVQGRSINEVYKIADQAGYMFVDRGNVYIEWVPTSVHYGKDTAGLTLSKVPMLTSDSRWLGEIAETVRDKMEERSKAQAESVDAIAQVKDDIGAIMQPGEATEWLDKLKTMTGTLRAAARKLLNDHCEAQGWKYDKASKAFVVADDV